MNKIYIFIPLILLFSSCKFVLLKWYGVKQPKLEETASLNKFLQKKDIQNNQIYTFKNVDSLNSFYKSGLGIPEAAFFNSAGLFIPYKETPASCNGGVKDFITDLKDKAIQADTNFHIQKLLNQIETEKQPVALADLPKTDFYMLMYWAKYLGKTNGKILDWEKEIAKARAKGLSITAIYVSCDYQKSWGISKKDIPKFNY